MIRAIRAYLTVESEHKFHYFTGALTKTVIYMLSPEARVYHGIRGVVSLLHISPLFTPGKREYELGTVYTPVIVRNDDEVLVPVDLTGEEYVIHIGGDEGIVKHISTRLDKLRNPTNFKFKDQIVTVKLEKKKDITREVTDKELAGDRLTLYLKGPVKLFNIFAPSRLPKFSISAYEILMTPYLIHKGAPTISHQETLTAMKLLGLLVETHYSLKTVKPIIVPFKGKSPAMIGKITYILDTNKQEIRETIRRVLNTAELVGAGRSRQNGFGTVTWKPK